MDRFYLTWLTLEPIGRLNLEYCTRILLEDGQPTLAYFYGDQDENETAIRTVEQYSVIADTIEEYVMFGRANGRLVRNPKYPDAEFRDYRIFDVIQKRLQREELDEVESIIFTPTTEFWDAFVEKDIFPFSKQQAYASAAYMVDVLNQVKELSEENGFWFHVATKEWKDGGVAPLEEPTFSLSADCSDFFYSATADSESVNEDNVDLYVSTYQDVAAVSEEVDPIAVGRLFAARLRNLYPVRSERYSEPVHALFQELAGAPTSTEEKD